MNKYADGGIVQRFAQGKRVKKLSADPYKDSIDSLLSDPSSILRQNAVGVAILKSPKTPIEDSSVSKKSILNSVSKKYSNILQAAIPGQIKIEKETLKPDVYNTFNQGIEEGLVQAVNTAVASVASKFPELPVPAINGDKERRKYLKGVNDAAKGNLFEEILTSMRNKGIYEDNPDPQRPFDFTPEKGSPFGLKQIFDKISSLLYVDAKASNPSNDNIAKKIANQTLRDLNVVSGRSVQNLDTSILDRMQPGKSYSLKDLGGISASQAKAAGLISPFRGKWTKALAAGGYIQKFASGGLTKAQIGRAHV